VRPDIAGLQNARHMAAADLFDDAALDRACHNLVERRRDPPLSLLRFTRQRDQLQSHFLRDAWRTATSPTLAYSLCAMPGNALAPKADRLHRYAQLPRNHRIGVTLMEPQRNPRPHHTR